jgi:hypothetical protein
MIRYKAVEMLSMGPRNTSKEIAWSDFQWLVVTEGTFPKAKRHFEQAPRVDRPPSALGYATPSSLPATQGQR